MDNFTFEAKNLELLAQELRVSAEHFRYEMGGTLATIGEEIKVAAQEKAKEHSTSIPPTLRTEPRPGAVAVIAGGANVPLAEIYELGNKGRGGRSSKTFKHPLFGDWSYPQIQPRYPFLRPALTGMHRQITKRMEQAWEKALEPLKLR